MNTIVYTTTTPYRPTQTTQTPQTPDGVLFCDNCETIHAYCECDEFAYLGTHSLHINSAHAHSMSY